MRQGTRVACLFLPFVLLLGAFICLLLVFLGDRHSSGASFSHNFYFIKFNTASFNYDGHALSGYIPGLKDWYTISLWNYCSGSSGSTTPSYCSPPTFAYYFNPSQVWSLADVAIGEFSSIDWTDALDTYRDVAKFTFIAYIIAIIATGLAIVLSFFAFCNRFASLLTTLTCTVSIIFSIAASAAASAMYVVLEDIVKKELGKYGVTASLGGTMFAVTWLAAAFAIIGGAFYFFSSCCCGVDNSHHGLRGDRRARNWRKGRGHRGQDSTSRVALMPSEAEKGYARINHSSNLFGPPQQQNTGYAPVYNNADPTRYGDAFEPYRNH